MFHVDNVCAEDRPFVLQLHRDTRVAVLVRGFGTLGSFMYWVHECPPVDDNAVSEG